MTGGVQHWGVGAAQVFAVQVAVGGAERPLAADVLTQAELDAGVSGAADVLGLLAIATHWGAAAGSAGGVGHVGVLDFVAQAAVEHGSFGFCASPRFAAPAQFDVVGTLRF